LGLYYVKKLETKFIIYYTYIPNILQVYSINGLDRRWSRKLQMIIKQAYTTQ